MTFLQKENCNKTHCKSCIFHPDFSKRIKLSEERISEIKMYLSKFESSHICHVTEKTCFGSLKFQSEILFFLGHINENSVESMLNEAEKFIK